MPIKHLESFFNPRRIAVVGASEDPESIGYFVLKNIVGKGFKGVVYPVHPDIEAIQGVETYKTITDIPHAVDLAILAVCVEEILDRLEECGRKGVKGVSIICPNFESRARDTKALEVQIKQLAVKYGFRVMGPNTMGFIRPAANLNASVFGKMPQRGSIAFISQSATLTTALLDRALRKNVGFSYIVSLGSKIDIGFSDLIDFLGIDPETKAIILYVEHIKRGRKFMTSVRSFAKSKPIVVVKSGKFDSAAQTILTHSGFLAGEDKVYDAAFKRAGAVRIDEIIDLFYMVETLAKQKRPKGKRLAVITNAGAPAILAADALMRLDGELATLGEDTLRELRRNLELIRQVENPVSLFTNAAPEDYMLALRACLKDPNIDGLLVLHVPYFGTRPLKTAEAVVKAFRENPSVPIFTNWMEGEEVLAARDFLNEQGIPTFITPEQAVKSFIYLYSYDSNLQLLQETPETILKDFHPDTPRAAEAFRKAAREKRTILTLSEVKEILQAYGIPVVTTLRADTEEKAVQRAQEIGYPVVLKIESERIFHKLEKGGVILNIRDEQGVREAFGELKEVAAQSGDTHADVLIQPMVIRHGYELMIGAKKDPTFGSVIIFGTGGELLEAIKDYAVGLPPLNQTLARRMMEETKIYKYLRGQESLKDTLRLLEEMLVRFSYLIVDYPWIKEIDINPFLFTEKQGFVLDAGILLEQDIPENLAPSQEVLCPPHLSICPYPFQYVNETVVDGVAATIRPIKPEDEPLIYQLFKGLSDRTILFRFGQHLKDMTHEQLVRYCQIDYDRELAFVATISSEGGHERVIADVRVLKMPDLETAELAILVADEWQGYGIGTMLVNYCIDIARESGIKTLWMEILTENIKMRHVGEITGFKQVYGDEDMVKVVKEL